MFKSREQAQYDAEVDALAKERQLYRDEAQKLAHKRQGAGEDTRELPLFYWLGWLVAQKTRGSARVDLVRPRFPAAQPGNLFRAFAPTNPEQVNRFDGARQGHNPYEQRQPLFGFGQGARLKVMRHIDFGVPDRFRRRGRLDRHAAEQDLRGERERFLDPPGQPLLQREPDFGAAVSSIKGALQDNFRPLEKPWFDFGAGVNLEFDEGRLTPSLRLKVKDFFSIKLLPEPMFKIQKRIRLGPSTMGLRINYELPFIDAQNLWAPPARLMVRVDNHMGGLKVSPGGADFDEQVLQLGDSTTVRGALSVDFPRALPLPQGERFFGWHARRLGIKTRW